MKTILSMIWPAMLSLGMTIGAAQAAPGDWEESSHVEVLEPMPPVCALHNGICAAPGARSTVKAAEDPNRHYISATTAPRFSRVGAAAAHGADAANVDDNVPWTIDVNATLRRRALAGNAVFLLYDANNPKSQSSREVSGAWQVNVPAGERLSARLTLSPQDGFHAGHTYRLRIVQLINTKEAVLAEGQFRLQ